MDFLSFLISVATAVVEVPLETVVPEVEEDAVVELDGSLEAVVTGAEEVVTGAEEVVTGAEEVVTGAEEVVTGAEEVVTGAEEVVTGEPDLFATLVEEALELEAVV
ncbi:MAG: hypothetical protein ACYCT9_07515, partial [Leptospirillum sp.]